MPRVRKTDSQIQRCIEATPDSFEDAINALEERMRYVEFHDERLREEAELWPGDFHGFP